MAKNEVRADIFYGSLAVFQFERVASAGGRKGGFDFTLPPALQILGEICSNFFECNPLYFFKVIGQENRVQIPTPCGHYRPLRSFYLKVQIAKKWFKAASGLAKSVLTLIST